MRPTVSPTKRGQADPKIQTFFGPEGRQAFFGPEGYQAFFGRFAPYFERDCLRSFTPCKSSEPRTMW
jgi:hypothetical protein